MNVFAENTGDVPFFTPGEVQGFGEGTDWQDEIYRTGIVQNHNLSFTGGAQNFNYAISGGYFDQEGVVINSKFKRYSIRANTDAQVKKWLKIGNNLTLAHTVTDNVKEAAGSNLNAGPIDAALGYPPVEDVYDEDGNYTETNLVQVPHPVAMARENFNKIYTTRMLGNLFGEIDFGKGLSFRTSIGADLLYNKANFYSPSIVQPGLSTSGRADINVGQSFTWNFVNQLNYNLSLNNHDISASLVYDLQHNRYEGLGTQNTQFFTNALGVAGIGTGAPDAVPTPDANHSEWALQSYLARVNYTFADKLLFTISGRVDGSSRFAKNKKYGFFPSGAIAYRLSEESFIQSAEAISNLKVRFGYGITGNQEIGLFQSLNALTSPNRPYTFDGKPAIGLVPSRLANDELGWESTEQFNLGFDIGLLDDRIFLTTDLYLKNTRDLLLNIPIPMTSGYSSKLANAGAMQNKGIELAINTVNFDGDFRWTTDFNIAFNHNEVTDLAGLEEFFAGTVGTTVVHQNNVWKIKEGEPMGSFFGFIEDGIFQNQAELDAVNYSAKQLGGYRYKDLNDDGAITEDDRTFIGRATPDFFGGLDNKFYYKNFDLGIFFNFVYGNDIISVTKLDYLYFSVTQNNMFEEVYDNYWRGEGTSDDISAPGVNAAARVVSTKILEDGSYLRLRVLTLGYTFPTANVDWMSRARVYLSADNLFVLTNYKYGYDPEVNTRGLNQIDWGVDNGAYPRPRTFTIGVNLTF
jgi:TonB-linked SusC/RagA family outer membrane protein